MNSTHLSSQGQTKQKKLHIKPAISSSQKPTVNKSPKKQQMNLSKWTPSQSTDSKKMLDIEHIASNENDYMMLDSGGHKLLKNQRQQKVLYSRTKPEILDSKKIHSEQVSRQNSLEKLKNHSAAQFAESNDMRQGKNGRQKPRHLNSSVMTSSNKKRELQNRPQTVQVSPKKKRRYATQSSQSSFAKRGSSGPRFGESSSKALHVVPAVNESDDQPTNTTGHAPLQFESSPDYQAKHMPGRNRQKSSGYVMTSLRDISGTGSKSNSRSRNDSSERSKMPKNIDYLQKKIKAEVRKCDQALQQNEKLKVDDSQLRKKKKDLLYRYRNNQVQSSKALANALQTQSGKGIPQIMASTGEFSSYLKGHITEAHLKGLQTQVTKYSIQFQKPSQLRPQTDLIPKQVTKKLRNKRNSMTQAMPSAQIDRVEQLKEKNRKKVIEPLDQQIFQVNKKLVLKGEQKAKTRKQRAVTAMAGKRSPVRQNNYVVSIKTGSLHNTKERQASAAAKSLAQKPKNSRSMKYLDKVIAEQPDRPSSFYDSEPGIDQDNQLAFLNSSQEWKIRRNKMVLRDQQKSKYTRVQRMKRHIQNITENPSQLESSQLEDAIHALMIEKNRRLGNLDSEDEQLNLQIDFKNDEQPMFEQEFQIGGSKSSFRDSQGISQSLIDKQNEEPGPEINSAGSYLNSVHVIDDKSKTSWPINVEVQDPEPIQNTPDPNLMQQTAQQAVNQTSRMKIEEEQIGDTRNLTDGEQYQKQFYDQTKVLRMNTQPDKLPKKPSFELKDKSRVDTQPEQSESLQAQAKLQDRIVLAPKQTDQKPISQMKVIKEKQEEQHTFKGSMKPSNSSSMFERPSVKEQTKRHSQRMPDPKLSSVGSSINISTTSKVRIKQSFKRSDPRKEEHFDLAEMINQCSGEQQSFSNQVRWSKGRLMQQEFDVLTTQTHDSKPSFDLQSDTKQGQFRNLRGVKELDYRFKRILKKERVLNSPSRAGETNETPLSPQLSDESEIDWIKLQDLLNNFDLPEEPLLTMDDINKRLCVKRISNVKQLKRWEYLKNVAPGIDIREQLTMHCFKTCLGQFSSFADIWEQKCEVDMLTQSLEPTQEMKVFKQSLPKYQAREASIENLLISVSMNQRYNDIVMRNICPVITFIQTRDESTLLKIKPISFFDAQTETGSQGVFKSFNWEPLKQHLAEFEQQVKEQEDVSDRIEEYIHDMLFDFQEVHEYFNKSNFQYIRVPSRVFEALEMKTVHSKARMMPIQFNYKISMCSREILDHCFADFINSKYLITLKGMQFEKNHQKVARTADVVESMIYLKSKGYNFFETVPYYYVSSVAGGKSINQSLFRFTIHKVTSILHNQSDDLNMNQQIAKLMQLYGKKNKVRMLEYYKFSDEQKDKLKDVRLGLNRSNSIDPNSLNFNKWHFIMNHHLFHDDLQKWRLHDSDEEHTEKRNEHIFTFKRQNALVDVRQEAIEMRLQQKVEARMTVLKDSCCTLYNRLFLYKDMDDQDYNEVVRSFGFKPKYIRRSHLQNMLMEVLVPCKMAKTQRKIDTAELRHLRFSGAKGSNTSNQLRRSLYLEDIINQGGDTNTLTASKLACVSPFMERLKISKKEAEIKSEMRKSVITWNVLAKLGGGVRNYAMSLIDKPSLNEQQQELNHEKIIKNKIKKLLKPEELGEVHDFETDDSMVGVTWDKDADHSDEEDKQEVEKEESAKKKREIKLRHIKNVTKDQTLKFYLAKNKDAQGKKRFYELTQIMNVEPKETMDKKKFQKMVQKKMQMDNAINQIENGALMDNAKQIASLNKELEFVAKVRQNAIERFNSKDQYEQSKQGNVIEFQLSKVETKIVKMISVLKTNLEYRFQQGLMKSVQNQLVTNMQKYQGQKLLKQEDLTYIDQLIKSSDESDLDEALEVFGDK